MLYTRVKQLYEAMRVPNGVHANIGGAAWYSDVLEALGIFNSPAIPQDLEDTERSENLRSFRYI